jgi:hypothetical protein
VKISWAGHSGVGLGERDKENRFYEGNLVKTLHSCETHNEMRKYDECGFQSNKSSGW